MSWILDVIAYSGRTYTACLMLVPRAPLYWHEFYICICICIFTIRGGFFSSARVRVRVL